MKIKDQRAKRYARVSAKAGLLSIVVAALTFEATTLIQFYFSARGLRHESERRAESELETTKLEIIDVIDQVETGLRNSVWLAQWALNHPDSIPAVSRRIVENNPIVIGSTMALVPGYDPVRPLYAPYVTRPEGSSSLVYKTLATEEYDYPAQEWFRMPQESGRSYWSEPYWDEGGGEILMTTYALPVFDKSGTLAAILTADVSLAWLTGLVSDIEVYPNAFSVVASRSGQIMVCPENSMIMNARLEDVLPTTDDDTNFNHVARSMLAGETGSESVRRHGEIYYIYFAPVERTGWSMSIIIPDEEIFGGLRRIAWIIGIMQLLGLLMLYLIIYWTNNNQLKYERISEKEKKMENDLQIASAIQMAMIPKVSPLLMERHDIDIAATIVPAREVGGDLYDFFIRDEKLFLCIGDVSGKGVSAALVMAMTRSQFRTLAVRESSPARIISAINDSVSEMNENDMFVTFFCAVLDLVTGHLRFCNAGHNAPYIFTGSIKPLPVLSNLALGILPGIDYEEQETDLAYDDALFLYTDGITEAENAAQELFGEERMIKALNVRRSAENQLEAVQSAVDGFVGNAPQSDDKTMLFLHYLNPTLILRNEISEINRLGRFVEAVARETGLNSSDVMNLNLAIEEAVTNVIMYAYPKGEEGLVTLEARKGDGVLDFILFDSGKPFDPTRIPDADTTLGAEARRIGGLGILLVRKLMDAVSYERKDDKNYLFMSKKI